MAIDHYTTSVAQQLRRTQAAMQERRAAPRRLLQRRIMISLPDNIVLGGQTIDLSNGGLRVSIPRALATPQDCTFEVSIMVEGQVQSLSGRGRILSCVCRGMDGFSIGLQFIQIGEAGKALVQRFLG